MKPYHVGCGGEIINKQCQRCKKRWNPVSYLTTPNEIRLMPGEPKVRAAFDKKTGTGVPKTAQEFASLLPKWPRWARILTVVVILLVIAGIIILIRR